MVKTPLGTEEEPSQACYMVKTPLGTEEEPSQACCVVGKAAAYVMY